MGMCIADNTDHPLLRCLFRFTILLPVTRCSGHNTDLPSNNNILKIVRVNIAFTKAFFLKKIIRYKLSNHVQVDRLCTCGSWFVELLESQKSSFSVFLVLKRLSKIKKI